MTPTTRIIKEYLGHGGREEMSDLWEPEDEQQEVFHYSLYEVAFELEVDLATGKSRIISVDGHKLETLPEFQ